MKAVIFDLYETLITEWGKPKYLTRDVAADLAVDYERFRQAWHALGNDRFTGKYARVQDAYAQALTSIGVHRDAQLLAKIADKRTQSKRACFDPIAPAIIDLLTVLKNGGYKIGLISNCAPEEIVGLQDCALFPYLDAVVLSCEVGMRKPNADIYTHCLSLLGEQAADCYFVGDGGSDELRGAKEVGLTPLRALWFIKHFAKNLDTDATYPAFYAPAEALKYINQ